MSYMLQIIEGPALQYINTQKGKVKGDLDYSPYESFQNCLWNVMVIVTTVGYGDYVPESTLGRFLTIFISISGIILVSTFITTLQTKSQFTEHEYIAKSFIQRLNSKVEVKKESSKYFKNTLTFLLAKNDYINIYDTNRHDVDHIIGNKQTVLRKTNIIRSDINYYNDLFRKYKNTLSSENHKKMIKLKSREEKAKIRLENALKQKLLQRKKFKDSIRVFNRTHETSQSTLNIRLKLKEIEDRVKTFKLMHEEIEKKLDFILEKI